MGRTILCPHCKSTFNEDILKKRNSENVCLVCGESLLGDESESISQIEVPCFGDGVELGVNDSFDEDKIDFWWYSIREPDVTKKSRGMTFTTCAKCGTHSALSYPIAKTGDYILISPKYHGKCNGCGNEMKNHILSKRPADWVDPRNRAMWVKDYENVPKCPICSSTKIHKISMTNKAVSALTWGVLAAGHVSKTYKCDTCGAKF